MSKSKRAEAGFNRNGHIDTPTAPVRSPLQPPRAHDLLQDKEEPEENLKVHSETLKKDRLGRVRMSVRMTPEQHLHLKLIAAHSHMSAQSIIEHAMDEYVERHGADLIPGACACIRDKMFR